MKVLWCYSIPILFGWFLRVPSVDALVFVLSKKYNFAKLASYIQSLLVCILFW